MLASLLATTLFSLLLFLTGAFVFLTPLPIALAWNRRGVVAALLAAALALLALASLYRAGGGILPYLPLGAFSPPLSLIQVAGLGLVSFFYYLWMGLSIGCVSQKKFGIEKSLILIVASGIFVPGAAFLLMSKALGMQPFVQIREGIEYLFQRMIEMQERNAGTDAAGAGDELTYLKVYGPALVTQMIALIPAVLLNATLLLSSLNILFLRRWSANAVSFRDWVDFALWKLPEKSIWAPIASGALFFLNLYLLKRPLIGHVALNALLVCGAVYFLQGIAIVTFLARTRFPPLGRTFLYLIILLFLQILGVFIVALGIFDFWFDFRKIKKVTSAPHS